VHIIPVNAASTAFSKTKNITFIVKNDGEALQNVDHYNSLALPTISAQAVHEMVINYFGGVARENLEKIRTENEPRLLSKLLNTTNSDFHVRFRVSFSLI
jgi:hypothetical protein